MTMPMSSAPGALARAVARALASTPHEVAECLREELRGPLGGSNRRRSSSMRGDFGLDSLSARSRAIVVGNQENGRGGAQTPPDPAPV